MARSGDLGWAVSGIRARGQGLETSQKVNLGRKWFEAEDEGKSSCEKLQAVLAVLLVVAVCQNTPSEIQIHAKVPKTGIPDLRNIYIQTPHSIGPPWVGGLPNSLGGAAMTRRRHLHN